MFLTSLAQASPNNEQIKPSTHFLICLLNVVTNFTFLYVVLIFQYI